MEEHTFSGLGEFREVLPRLATASAHDVFTDLGAGHGAGRDRPADPQRLTGKWSKAIWNDRDDRQAYVGSDDYVITQHEQVLRYIDEAVGQSVGEIDIGRIRDYGERLDGMITLDGVTIDVKDIVGDDYIPPDSALLDDRTQSVPDAFRDDSGWARDILGAGIRFANSFDGSERIRLQTMAYRYVCQNWMVWGEETIGEFEMLHIEELDADVVAELIHELVDKQEEAEGIIEDVTSDMLKPSWVGPLLEEAGFGPQYQKQIAQELAKYDQEDGEWSRWALYNAVLYVLDHDVVNRVNPNVYDRKQGQAQYFLENEVTSPSEEIEFDEIVA